MLTLVAVWPLWMQFLGPQAVHGTLAASNVFVTDVAGFVLPTSLQAIAPPALTAVTDRFSGSQYEAGAFLGLPLLVAQRGLVFTDLRLGAFDLAGIVLAIRLQLAGRHHRD